MAKTKKARGQTTIYKTLHRKLKIEQHEPPLIERGEIVITYIYIYMTTHIPGLAQAPENK